MNIHYSNVWNVEQEVSFYFVRRTVDVTLPGDEDLVFSKQGSYVDEMAAGAGS